MDGVIFHFISARLNLKDPHVENKSAVGNRNTRFTRFCWMSSTKILNRLKVFIPHTYRHGNRKRRNRQSLEDILPLPAPVPLPHPETSFCQLNSGRRPQVIIRQGPGVYRAAQFILKLMPGRHQYHLQQGARLTRTLV
ncbi:hypothetical protein BPOR_0021g00390 [Botrytis porri]|uniref:Uncharacterized protein n=1 Tax=Botrytis porri TaxID=87229 RepID=A0A4Z1L4E7_9HELO|nr:hypothetical protein BPOR_0021g00390 [Botrytis porri]